jgi:hypothetical protein
MYSVVLVMGQLLVRRTTVLRNVKRLTVEHFQKTFTYGFGCVPRYRKEYGENVWNFKVRAKMVSLNPIS